jgi:hypothetical protein
MIIRRKLQHTSHPEFISGSDERCREILKQVQDDEKRKLGKVEQRGNLLGQTSFAINWKR